MKYFRFLLILPFLLLARPTFAQTQDFGSWMTLSVNKGIVGNLEFNFDQEFRLRNNLTEVNLLYTNLGLSYKFTKWFRVGVIYRFIDKHKETGEWGLRNRFMQDLVFKIKPGDFAISYRARFQEEFRGYGYASDYGNIPEVFMRNLFKVSYKLNDHFSPYAGAELRWQLQNPRMPEGNGFDRTRFFAGTDYEINKKQTAGMYFLLQKEWNVSDPQTLYILGLEYSLSFD